MSVVSDSSPLIRFARLGNLELLHTLYGERMVPEAVWDEVVVSGAGHPGGEEVARAPWIRRRPVANRPLVQALRQHLAAGEAEAIALALEMGAEFLLMDDRLGRPTARRLGVRPIGPVGVRLEAKRQGVIPAVRPYLDALRDAAGSRLGDEVYARVLRDAGEA